MLDERDWSTEITGPRQEREPEPAEGEDDGWPFDPSIVVSLGLAAPPAWQAHERPAVRGSVWA